MNTTVEDNAEQPINACSRSGARPGGGKAWLASGTAKAMRAIRRRASWLRVAVSAGLIYLILRQTSFSEISILVEQSLDRWPILLVALALPVMGVTIAALRWAILLGGLGVRPPLRLLYRAIMVGMFFNQVLPSTIGGDVARSLLLRQSTGSTAISLAVVGLDRLIGVLGMGAVALVAASFGPAVAWQLPGFWIALSLIGGVGVAFGLFSHPRIATGAQRVFAAPLWDYLRAKVSLARQAIISLRQPKRRMLVALLLSAALQLAVTCVYFALSRALGISLSFEVLIILVPIVNLISLLPISINGIGLREAAWAMLGLQFGLNAGDAIALGWSFMLIGLVWGLLGGVVYLVNSRSSIGADNEHSRGEA